MRSLTKSGQCVALQRILLVLAIVAVDQKMLRASWLPLHGLADEVSHQLTAFIWLTAALALGLRLQILPGLLAALVIDLDHVPVILGLLSPPTGTSRPVTHSLSLVVLAGTLAAIDSRRRKAWIAVAVGLLSHLVRDLGTGAVLMWWPLANNRVSLPYSFYLTLTVMLATIPLLSTSLTLRRGSLAASSRVLDTHDECGQNGQNGSIGTVQDVKRNQVPDSDSDAGTVPRRRRQW